MTDHRDALRRYPLLALADLGWLDAWIASGRVEPVEVGQGLFAAGSTGTDVYLVLAGAVRVLRQGRGGEVGFSLLGPGELFGEYALLEPGRNTATCRVAQAGRLLRLPLGPLKEHITALLAGRARLKDWLRLHFALAHLRGRTCLGFMSATSFLPLLERFEPVRFAAGTTMQANGFLDDSAFLIQEGQVRTSERTFGAGDFLGEAALLSQGSLAVTEAVSDVECLALSRDALSGRAGVRQSTFQTITPVGHVPRCHEWVGQRDRNDCGVASLAMAALAMGRRLVLEEVHAQVQLEARGASLLELRRAAGELGLRAEAVRVGIDHLSAVCLPAVAHLVDGHYVTLFEVHVDAIVVGDPGRGVGRWPIAEFRRRWAGDLLLLATAEGG
jgi:CRP-like cAMP-binding protein